VNDQGLRGRQARALQQGSLKRPSVVEHSFNALKQWRSPATRYDKLALTYRSAVVLPEVVIWSAALGDTP
jgi:transposase